MHDLNLRNKDGYRGEDEYPDKERKILGGECMGTWRR